MLDILVCPKSKAPLEYHEGPPEVLICRESKLVYRVEDGIPIMLIEEATPLDESLYPLRQVNHITTHDARLRASSSRLSPMSEQPLSEGAERVLGEARAEAERLGHEFIGSEHLLLGLLRSSDLARSSARCCRHRPRGTRTALENGQKRVRVRSDAPQAEGVPLSSHARRLLEAGAAGDGPLEAKLLLAALTDRRGALTRFLGDKGIDADAVIAEVATRAGMTRWTAPARRRSRARAQPPSRRAAPKPRQEKPPARRSPGAADAGRSEPSVPRGAQRRAREPGREPQSQA